MCRLARLLLLLFVIVALSGCAKVVIKSDSDPNVDLTALKSFYVQKFAPDKRNLHEVIANKLNELGFKATSGVDPAPEVPVDALVTYKDRWMWDMTNYMLEINIDFRNPETNYLFASGKSYRTSLARKPPEYMIDEALRDLFSMQVQVK
jgi:hypothetical protein